MQSLIPLKVVVVILVAALAALTAIAVTVAFSHRQETITRTDALYGELPGYKGLTIDQRLDRGLELPGVSGLVLGRTASPTVSSIPDPGTGLQTLVTDYPFTILKTLGAPPYRVDTTITLRIPGGTSGNVTTVVEDAPVVTANEGLYVFVRDQGVVAGGNAAQRLVASSSRDVFSVENGTVHGQGVFAGFVEPVSTFEQHFSR